MRVHIDKSYILVTSYSGDINSNHNRNRSNNDNNNIFPMIDCDLIRMLEDVAGQYCIQARGIGDVLSTIYH